MVHLWLSKPHLSTRDQMTYKNLRQQVTTRPSSIRKNNYTFISASYKRPRNGKCKFTHYQHIFIIKQNVDLQPQLMKRNRSTILLLVKIMTKHSNWSWAYTWLQRIHIFKICEGIDGDLQHREWWAKINSI